MARARAAATQPPPLRLARRSHWGALGLRAGRAGAGGRRGRDGRAQARKARGEARSPFARPRSERVRATCWSPSRRRRPPGTYEGPGQGRRRGVPGRRGGNEPLPSSSSAAPTMGLEGRVGQVEEQVHVSVLNDGNVALEIAGAGYAFGLFAERGRRGLAFATAFREDTERKGERRLDRFVEGVADQGGGEHGGFVRVRVAEGSGVLEPGEVRSLGLGGIPVSRTGLEGRDVRTGGRAHDLHGVRSLAVRATGRAGDHDARGEGNDRARRKAG